VQISNRKKDAIMVVKPGTPMIDMVTDLPADNTAVIDKPSTDIPNQSLSDSYLDIGTLMFDMVIEQLADNTAVPVPVEYIDPAISAQNGDDGGVLCGMFDNGQLVQVYNAFCHTDGNIYLSNVSAELPSATISVSTDAPAAAMSATVDYTVSQPSLSCTRKRKRNESNWVRNKRRQLRNTGQEYVSLKNKVVRAKVFEAVGKCCNQKCVTNITEDERNAIFTKFWQLGSFSAQTAYIAGCVTQRHVSTRRIRDPEDKPVGKNTRRKSFGKTYSRQYTLCTGDRCIKVCKVVFLKTLAISDGRMNRALVNERRNVGVVQGDKRGKIDHKTQRIPEVKVAEVEAHIRSFPVNISHYTRSHSEERRYLSPNLSINEMYRLYVQKCAEDDTEPVKDSMYRHIFNTKFNLAFHAPWKDTCKKCDCMKTAIEAEKDICRRKTLSSEHELHLRKAECARKSIQADREKGSVPNYEAFTFDLQKVFSLPNLTTGEAFYCRQLSAYNLGIHSLSTGKVTMNVWHEGVASRGPDEISSCLLDNQKSGPVRYGLY
jgi:hypothetical protein